jgi:uncharacterized protein DUF2760
MHYDEIFITAAVTAALMVGLWLVLRAKAAGDSPAIREGKDIAARMANDAALATRVRAALEPPPPPKPSGEPLRLLALLQREGRLLDFLLEDVQQYANEQIGAAVRDIHRNCKKALQDHLVLVPVLAGEEQSAVEVAPGFDPSAIRLTGNVTGQPPFKGTLLHHGWRVKEIKLANPAEGQDEFVVQPAEVELS